MTARRPPRVDAPRRAPVWCAAALALVYGGCTGARAARTGTGATTRVAFAHAAQLRADDDSDGVPNGRDGCPAQPEDRDGHEDADGCPDPDDDRDRIADAQDLCPNEPEDYDGFEDADGCPDPDNDRDRIADANDRCPNEPETYNGNEDADGCPDTSIGVVVFSCPLGISQRVGFARRSARPRAAEAPVLAALAATLQGNPSLTRVQLAGFAGDVPDRGGGRDALALRRAEAVRAALVARGVTPARLVVRGFGRASPPCPDGGCVWPDAGVALRVIETSDGPVAPEQ